MDASPFRLGAVLSHKIDGKLHPIAYISHTLSTAEKNYAQIDRKATAIYWTKKKFYQFLYGRKFTLVTDNQPLKMIFDPNKNLPATVVLRLLRYALHLRQFEYEMQYRPSKNHTNIDFLSRKPTALTLPDKPSPDEGTFTAIINRIRLSASDRIITHKDVKKATTEDAELSKLLNDLQMGNTNNVEFTCHNGVIYRGSQIVVPASLHQYVLDELHHTH